MMRHEFRVYFKQQIPCDASIPSSLDQNLIDVSPVDFIQRISMEPFALFENHAHAHFGSGCITHDPYLYQPDPEDKSSAVHL